MVTLVHDSLHVEDCTMSLGKNLEYIKTKIRATKDYVFTLVNAYIPSQGLQEGDLSAITPDSRNFMLVGDFNSKHSSWNDGPENGNGSILFKWIQTHNIILQNQKKEATYQSPSTSTLNTLDLTLVSPPFDKRIKHWSVERTWEVTIFWFIANLGYQEGWLLTFLLHTASTMLGKKIGRLSKLQQEKSVSYTHLNTLV